MSQNRKPTQPPTRQQAQSLPLPPSSRKQLWQLFTDVSFSDLRTVFCRQILTNLKFRNAPQCAARLIRRTQELAVKGRLDNEIYDELYRLVHAELFTSSEYIAATARDTFDRGKNRVEQLEPIFKHYLTARKVASYLDVGCNEGNITHAVGEMLGAASVHGCDVVQPDAVDGFTFTLLDPGNPNRLPYGTAGQDVVSAFMSLHHIAHPELTLAEIHRVLREDGVFFIREHDCQPPQLALLLDLMHGFYAMVWPQKREMEDFATHFSHYRTGDQLAEMITGIGFTSVHRMQPIGAWRYYYQVFVKSENHPDDLVQLFHIS